MAVLLSAASIAIAAPFAYVSSFSQDRVTVVDGANGSVAATITLPGGAMPYGVAVNPAGTRVYVANFGGGSVSIIDTATNQQVSGSPVTVCVVPGCMPQGIAVNSTGTRVYVANADGTIAVIDATTNTLLTPLVSTIGTRAFGGIVVVGSSVFVADFGSGSVLAINVNTGVITALPLSFSMFGIAANPAGTRVYVPYGKINNNQEYDLEVAVIDPSGPVIVASVPVGTLDNNSGSSPAGIAVNPAGTRVYVAVSLENRVDVIDTATNQRAAGVPEGGVPVGAAPYGVALDASGARVFVGRSGGSGTLAMIDTATNTVIGTPIGVGASPLAFGSFVGTPPTPQYTLTTGTSPSAGGTITPATGGKYDAGTTVSVTATANTGYQFTGWAGACTGTGPCSVTMTSDKTVIANFALVQYTLTTGTSPSAGGTITPATGRYDHGTQVSVTATANTGYQFTGWSGGTCTGTGPCSVTMTSDKSVTANFALVQYTLTTGASPSGAGTVTPATGSKYDAGTQVSVTATANAGYQFTGWSGGTCTGTGPCSVTMTSDKSVTANFALVQYTLTTGASPSGAGTVTPATGSKYNYGTQVTVAATGNTGYQFTGWSGACTGAGPCSVTMTSDRSVTANYALVQYTLTTGTSPSGAGTVTPATGSKYNFGTQVSVTATASTGYQFTGWSGACTGTGACSVAMSSDKSVTANFAVVQQQFSLTLATNGTGTGTVGALPSSSTGKYNAGTDVAVTAAPGTGCKFNGWSGACSGNGDCKVRMDAAKSVTANFILTSVPTCDEKIGDLKKKVAADKHHLKYGHSIREALRLYAAAQQELARAKAKVGDRDKKYLSALKELDNGKAAFCAGRYWRAAHEFWEAYQIAHKILEQHRR